MPEEPAPKEKPRPKQLPESARDEVLLKFVGTGTLVVGLVLLVATVIAISILSIMKFDIAPWLPIIPLSLLVVLIGGLVNGYYRVVLDQIAHPEKARAAQLPAPYANPWWYPVPTVPSGPPVPPPASPRPAPAGPANTASPTPPVMPTPPSAIPDLATRFCVTCGRRIPVESRFCPYCRRAYPA